jgi:mRNA interferase RelE/StbE
MYKVIIDKRAKKEIDKIPIQYAKKIALAIYDLEDNPRPIGSKKLVGFDNLYRIRIGMYRIIYRIIDDILYVEVLKVGHRSAVYQ